MTRKRINFFGLLLLRLLAVVVAIVSAFWRWVCRTAKAYPLQFSVAVVVIVLHIGFLVYLGVGDNFKKVNTKLRPIAVKTVVLKEQQKQPSKASVSTKAVSEKKKKVVETKKKTKKVVKKKEDTKQDKLLKLAKESIAKTQVPSKNITVPKMIGELNIDRTIVSDPSGEDKYGYREEVMLLLKSLLRLPEHGNVKVELTLSRDGRVASVIVVSTDSKRNKEYVEKAIPEVVFPSFGKHFVNQQEHTFLITLASHV